MAETITDAQHRKLSARYGSSTPEPDAISELLRRYWVGEGYSTPPVGLAEKLHYISKGAVGASLADLRYDYWARKAFEYDTGAAGVGSDGAGIGGVVAMWKANRYSGAGELPDLTGRGRNLQLGSAAGADGGDPLWLPYTGEKYAYFPNIVANKLSTSDSVALSIVGDIDIRVRLSADDWSPSGTQTILAKSGVNFSYVLDLVFGGPLRLMWSATGAIYEQQRMSTVPVPLADGAVGWVRATLDVVAGANHEVKFYTSADGLVWTQLGATVTTAGATSIFDSGDALNVGMSVQDGTTWSGRIYRAQIRNNILNDGTGIVYDMVADDAVAPFVTFNERSVNAAVITIGRSAGRKLAIVDRSLFLFGTDDYMETPDHPDLDFDATQDFTVVWVGRVYNHPANCRFLSKYTPGWLFYAPIGSVVLHISDGANAIGTPISIADGVVSVVAGIVDRPTSQVIQRDADRSASQSPAPVGSLVNANPLRVGVDGSALSDFADMEFVAAAIVRRALTATEVTALGQELVA